MNERVKVFTYVSGHGATIIESPLEETINRWLASVNGELIQVTQSESTRADVGHHVTICVWYVPEAPAENPE